MSRYSIEEFVKQTQQLDKGEGLFELESPRILEINLTNQIWAKAGAMISYRGNIKFEREGISSMGLVSCLKKL